MSDARQPEVDFLHSWAVFLPKFWTNRLYNKKETKKYKFGIVNLFWNEKDLTSGWRRSKTPLLRDGPLENLWGGRGPGEVPKKYSRNGNLNEKKFMHAN